MSMNIRRRISEEDDDDWETALVHTYPEKEEPKHVEGRLSSETIRDAEMTSSWGKCIYQALIT
jgi:hypothetical protein